MTVHPRIVVRCPFTDTLHKLSVYRQFTSVCLLAILCFPVWSYAQSAQRSQNESASPQSEEQPTAPAASAPTLEHMPAHLPTVTFRNGELTIVAYNATLRDILEMVRTQTGATVDIPPDANERVMVRLGPGPARQVLDSLLAGSDFNFIMLGSESDPQALTKVVLFLKPGTGTEMASSQEAAQVSLSRIASAVVRRRAPLHENDGTPSE